MKKSVVVMIGLLCVIIFCTKGTLQSRAEGKEEAQRQQYHEMEKRYLEATREVLEAEGIKNSGVNLTKTIDGEGNRVYTMTIHNSKINRMDEEEKASLLVALQTVKFEDETCEIFHEFLAQ